MPTVDEPLAGIVPPVSETEFVVDDAVPPQVVAMFVGFAFTRPDGYVSVNAAPVMAVLFEFDSVIVSRDVAPAATVEGANALLTEGPASAATGFTVTPRVAV